MGGNKCRTQKETPFGNSPGGYYRAFGWSSRPPLLAWCLALHGQMLAGLAHLVAWSSMRFFFCLLLGVRDADGGLMYPTNCSPAGGEVRNRSAIGSGKRYEVSPKRSRYYAHERRRDVTHFYIESGSARIQKSDDAEVITSWHCSAHAGTTRAAEVRVGLAFKGDKAYN